MAFALFGSPSSEGDLTDYIGDQKAHLEGYTSRQKEQVMRVYEKLCEQSKLAKYLPTYLQQDNFSFWYEVVERLGKICLSWLLIIQLNFDTYCNEPIIIM